jgi:glycosyltransferase involved in cell wall biosynthesis
VAVAPDVSSPTGEASPFKASTPRRVALVIGQLQQGGAEGQLVHLANGLLSGGYQPVVACLSEVSEPHGSSLRRKGIDVKLFPRKGRADFRRVMALASWLKEEKIDLVHSFLVGANSYAYAAVLIARRPKLIVSSRTTMKIPGTAARMVHRWVFRHATAVVANSASVREFTMKYYGVPGDRIRVIRNGVVLRDGIGDDHRRRHRAELGVDDLPVLVVTLGRLSPEKNLSLFVELAEKLDGTNPETRFIIVGDGPERQRLESIIRAKSLQHRVIMAGARSDVSGFLSAMDIFVLTSDTEGLPNAVMEAMGAGLPVVASRVGGTHEVVADGATGFLVAPGDSDAFIRAISALLQEPQSRVRFGQAGRARIAGEFSVAKMVSGTCRLYDQVCAGTDFP